LKCVPEDPKLKMTDIVIGSRRIITWPPDAKLVEVLTDYNKEKHYFSYEIVEKSPGAFPGETINHKGTLGLAPSESGASTLATWSSSFDGQDETADLVKMFVEENIFAPGLDRVAARFAKK